MASTERYLNQLIEDKKTLANNLVEKGVEASEDETFTELVPKVLDIQSGGATIEKGLVINAIDSDGYITDASIVGMTEIPEYYFNYCFGNASFLKNIGKNFHLPTNLTAIGKYAFNSCPKLAITELPEGITSIGQYAFSGCSELALTKLPLNLTRIESDCFNNCTKLALTELPSGINYIGSYSFGSCTNLALTELPSGVTLIGSSAFTSCTNLALTKLPSGITSIASSAFRNCTNLALTELPENVQSLAEACFQGCTNLALTSLPEKLSTIYTNVFSSCSNLKIKKIPALTKLINPYAFRNCIGITELDILSDLYTTLSNSCFEGCSNLTKIIIRKTSVPTITTTTFKNTPIENGTGYIYVSDTLVESFKVATNWSTYASQIKGISELPAEEE